MTILRGLAIALLACTACGDPNSGPSGKLREDQLKLAKLGVDRFAFQDYPQWSTVHVSKDCPADLAELAAHGGGHDTSDPWGTPYKMFCGKGNLPPGATGGFAVLSFGPDRKEGTDDDVRSWEPIKRP